MCVINLKQLQLLRAQIENLNKYIKLNWLLTNTKILLMYLQIFD